MRELLRGARIRLTAAYEGDDEQMAPWYEDSDFMRLVDTDIAFPKTPDKVKEEMASSPTCFTFRLRALGDDKPLGFVALHSIEWNNQAAMLAIGIGDQAARGRGYGTEALALILQYAFYELGLHRVGLNVISYNESAAHLYVQAGFVTEGRLRENIYRDGQRYDCIQMGLLRAEWEALQGKPE